MYQELKTSWLRESSLNPRKTFDESALAELAESIRAHGILEPLVVRGAKDSLYEVVCGARRLRAARLAGLQEVPCVLISATDEQALELMLVENSQRADVDPFEEAEALGALVGHGRDAGELAARLGRTPRWVRQRLLLRGAPEDLVEWYRAGSIPLGGAMALCAAATEVRAAAMQDIGRHIEARPVLTLRDVRFALERVSRPLSAAPWGLADDTLPGPAGGCSACPRRSRTQLDLWDAGEDRCLDGQCWTAREAEWWRVRSAEIEAAGGQVVEVEDQWRMHRSGLALDGDPVDEDLVEVLRKEIPGALDGAAWAAEGTDDDEDAPELTWGELRRRLRLQVPESLVRAPTWNKSRHEYSAGVAPEALADALEQAGAQRVAAALRGDQDDTEERQRRQAELDARVEAQRQERDRRLARVQASFLEADIATRLRVLWVTALDHLAGQLPKTEKGMWQSISKMFGKHFSWRLPQMEAVLGLTEEPEEADSADDTDTNADTFVVPTCRVCGCTDDDCSGCVERTGEPCHWVEPDLCSACVAGDEPAAEEPEEEEAPAVPPAGEYRWSRQPEPSRTSLGELTSDELAGAEPEDLVELGRHGTHRRWKLADTGKHPKYFFVPEADPSSAAAAEAARWPKVSPEQITQARATLLGEDEGE